MPLILPGNVGSATAATSFNVANSLRFNDGSSDYLSISNGTPTSLRIYTFSAWVKKTATGALRTLYSNGTNGDNYMYIHFNNSTEQLEYVDVKSGEYQVNLKTTRVFRDPSAWYHIMIAVDTTQGTNTNRVKFYINGVQETSFVETTYPDQNDDLILNGSNTNIGRYVIETDRFYDGYMSEVVFVDGTQQANTDLGEFDDSGIWKPIDVSGLTFGDNGYYLEFKQAGTSQNSSGMGADTSGEDNHFAVSNLTAVDQSVDTCTNNFATLNPLSTGNKQAQRHVALSEGNLFAVGNSSSNNGNAYTTMAVNTGKWYCEIKATDVRGTGYPYIGVCNETCHNQGGQAGLDSSSGVDGVAYSPDGRKNINGTSSSYGNTFTDNDIIGIALDLDNGAVYFSKNGTFEASGDPTSGASKTNAVHTFTVGDYYFFAIAVFEAASDVSCNFGSPAFAISSSNTDGSGFGNFEYAVPSGYFALCTKNLAEHG